MRNKVTTTFEAYVSLFSFLLHRGNTSFNTNSSSSIVTLCAESLQLVAIVYYSHEQRITQHYEQ